MDQAAFFNSPFTNLTPLNTMVSFSEYRVDQMQFGRCLGVVDATGGVVFQQNNSGNLFTAHFELAFPLLVSDGKSQLDQLPIS
jgi:hypothetical protein